MKKAILLDGNNLAMRCRNTPRLAKLRSRDGKPTGVQHGFLAAVFAYERIFHDAPVFVVWDGPELRRRQAFPAYKAHRSPPPNVDTSDVAWIKKVLPLFGWTQHYASDEADDHIASLVARDASASAVIVSTDRDFTSLVSPCTTLCVPKPKAQKEPSFQLLTPDLVHKMYGVPPLAFTLLRALAGDTSDGIPGVSGFSWKWAAKVLVRTGCGVDPCVDRLFRLLQEDPKSLLPAAKRKALLANEPAVRKNVKLLTLRTDDEALVVQGDLDAVKAIDALRSLHLKGIEMALVRRENDRRQLSLA